MTADPAVVRDADRIVLPGQGAFGDCMDGLTRAPGLLDAVEYAVRRRAVPFLGICVGMQLLATRGLEHQTRAGFDWLGGEVVALAPGDPALKIPHMGWQDLVLDRPEHPMLAGLADGTHVYFVHSFHFVVAEPADRVARVDYGGAVTAMVARDNLFGTQFHPEKSQAAGLRLVANFLTWCP